MREENSHLHADFGDRKPFLLWRKIREDRRRIEREIERINLGYEPEPEEQNDDA